MLPPAPAAVESDRRASLIRVASPTGWCDATSPATNACLVLIATTCRHVRSWRSCCSMSEDFRKRNANSRRCFTKIRTWRLHTRRWGASVETGPGRSRRARNPRCVGATVRLAAGAFQSRDCRGTARHINGAIAEYRLEIDQHPNSYMAQFNLWESYERLGDHDAQVQAVRSVDQEQPSFRGRLFSSCQSCISITMSSGGPSTWPNAA